MPALPEDEGDGDRAARGAESARPLELPECEGLPRQMLESVRERPSYVYCTKLFISTGTLPDFGRKCTIFWLFI